jgi:ABC-type amino acid transport substrate-binding protein
MGILGDWYSEEQAKDFLYSDPIMKTKIVFFALADRGIKYDKSGNLSGLTIGVVRGNSASVYFSAQAKGDRRYGSR